MSETTTILSQEPMIRLGFFAGSLCVMIALEALFPRRERRLPRLERWPANFTIALLDGMIVRLAFPLALVGWALTIEANGQGLLNQLSLPWVVEFGIAMILLDLIIWAQHLAFHRVPLLWRFHRMHHTDLDLDATSGARFHPIEILLSALIKFAAIGLLGTPAVAVMWFEVILSSSSIFNHSNLRLPGWLDSTLRVLIVTPDMHRVHHSVRPEEINSNFGFNLSLWDRVFGTYRAQPEDGHTDMTLGLSHYQDNDIQRIDQMLMVPFNEARPTPGQ